MQLDIQTGEITALLADQHIISYFIIGYTCNYNTAALQFVILVLQFLDVKLYFVLQLGTTMLLYKIKYF